MSESVKCPECSVMLNRDSVIHHLTVDHQWSLKVALRWAGLRLGLLEQGSSP